MDHFLRMRCIPAYCHWTYLKMPFSELTESAVPNDLLKSGNKSAMFTFFTSRKSMLVLVLTLWFAGNISAALYTEHDSDASQEVLAVHQAHIFQADGNRYTHQAGRRIGLIRSSFSKWISRCRFGFKQDPNTERARALSLIEGLATASLIVMGFSILFVVILEAAVLWISLVGLLVGLGLLLAANYIYVRNSHLGIDSPLLRRANIFGPILLILGGLVLSFGYWAHRGFFYL
jgi:hypothetical protein